MLCAVLGTGAGLATEALAKDALAPTGRWSAYTAGRAATPPMGWNSWNAFATDIDEDKILGSAQRIVDSGLAAKGYRYINLDDGWALKRRMPDGHMIIRADKFPSRAHRRRHADLQAVHRPAARHGAEGGHLFGPGPQHLLAKPIRRPTTDLPKGSVLEREVGLYGHIDQDIALYFEEWGFDLHQGRWLRPARLRRRQSAA